ncbi:uncharacterized protein LOC105640816 [Jatropha curcas]|uniref:uncharacterized protein LOC105640816 n=1 Tax=Jatropha curcas TaxID=180498 RepID=UPI001895E475|nr:uncharacterized protein LOC105640816 [Jatropha curcas]
MNPPPKVSPPSAFTVLKGALDGNGPVLTRTFGNEKINISVMRLANIIPGSGGEDDDDDINQLFLHVDVSKPGQEKSLQFLCGLYPDALGIHSFGNSILCVVDVAVEQAFSAGGQILDPTRSRLSPNNVEMQECVDDWTRAALRTQDQQNSSDDDNSDSLTETSVSFVLSIMCDELLIDRELDEKMRDALHSYIEERGVNESLFNFLQAWLYVKDHRNLMRWFKSVGMFINENKSTKSG